MPERIQRMSLQLAATLTAFGLCSAAGAAVAEDWSGNDPARSSSGRMEDHRATSSDPEDSTAESHDPEDMLGESEDLEEHEADSENPAAMVTGAGEMREYEPTRLSDLPEVSPDGGATSISVPGQSEWDATSDAELVLARNKLVRAQNRARKAITAYGDAERDDYPRGAARVRIVEERDAAMKALEAAKSELADLE